MRACLGLSIAVLLASCGPIAAPQDHVWTVKSPPKVELDSTLRFTVETRSPADEAIGAVPFLWTVEWVGAQEPLYQGSSFREQAIGVKGSPGTATIQILAVDHGDRLVEVARASFEVTPAHPPAE